MHTIYRAIWRAHTVGTAAFSMLIRLHPQTSFSRPKCSCWKSLTLQRCCSAHRESNHVPFVAYICGTHCEIRFHMKQWVWCAETTIWLIWHLWYVQSHSHSQPHAGSTHRGNVLKLLCFRPVYRAKQAFWSLLYALIASSRRQSLFLTFQRLK